MKLDRNINANGMGKYALLKLRALETFRDQGAFGEVDPAIANAIHTLEEAGILDWGDKPETEFFVIRLKDHYANHALTAYARIAEKFDPEYAAEIFEMAGRAGQNSPFCKEPD